MAGLFQDEKAGEMALDLAEEQRRNERILGEMIDFAAPERSGRPRQPRQYSVSVADHRAARQNAESSRF